jgi:hypothetical protein
MKKYLWIIISFFSIVILNTGCDKAVDGESSGIAAFQRSGCLAKTADSCFSYTFGSVLATEFCVTANCCPETNRFIFEHDIISDTVNLYITDIEERLCRCVCSYNLHASFMDLVMNSYQFNILIRYRESEYELLYSTRVYRN